MLRVSHKNSGVLPDLKIYRKYLSKSEYFLDQINCTYKKSIEHSVSTIKMSSFHLLSTNVLDPQLLNMMQPPFFHVVRQYPCKSSKELQWDSENITFFSMMCQSQHWPLASFSQMPLSRNKLLSSQLREQSSLYSKPLNWKEQQLSRLRVRPKQQNKLVSLWLQIQHILIWDAWRQQRTLQQLWDRVEIKSISILTLFSWTSHNHLIRIWIEEINLTHQLQIDFQKSDKNTTFQKTTFWD